jgi:hypothetical protein
MHEEVCMVCREGFVLGMKGGCYEMSAQGPACVTQHDGCMTCMEF